MAEEEDKEEAIAVDVTTVMEDAVEHEDEATATPAPELKPSTKVYVLP